MRPSQYRSVAERVRILSEGRVDTRFSAALHSKKKKRVILLLCFELNGVEKALRVIIRDGENKIEEMKMPCCDSCDRFILMEHKKLLKEGYENLRGLGMRNL
jgi:transcriptional regulatory protein LevR